MQIKLVLNSTIHKIVVSDKSCNCLVAKVIRSADAVFASFQSTNASVSLIESVSSNFHFRLVYM